MKQGIDSELYLKHWPPTPLQTNLQKKEKKPALKKAQMVNCTWHEDPW